MSSTFAVQPIPPFNPRQSNQPLLPSFSSTPSEHLHVPSSSSATSEQQSSSLPVLGASGATYPSVFEIPNPQKSSDSVSRMNRSELRGGVADRALSRVLGDDSTADSAANGKKRRAIDEIEEGNRSIEARRRSSQESTERISSTDRGVRASFSFPANPHPHPQSQPQSQLHSQLHSHSARHSVSSIPSPPPRNPPSPSSARDSREHGPSDRPSPTASKRARTSALGALESLAATASDLLTSSTSSATSAMSSSDSTPPTTAVNSIASVIGPPSDSQTRNHYAAFESSRQLRDQQKQEIERRRIASGGGPASHPPGSAAAALDKLKSDAHQALPSRTAESDPDRRREDEDERKDGLGKRRGHRPPAVTTNSFPPPGYSSTAVTSGSLSAHEDLSRSALALIPSVLVGSPVEATWAARMGKEAGVGSARNGGNASHSRRQSTTAATSPYPSTREQPPHSRSSISSSSHPRGHFHQTSSSHLASLFPRDRNAQPAPSPSSHTHSQNPVPLPSTAHSHLPSVSHSHDRQQPGPNPGPRLPPINLVHPRTGSSGVPPPSSFYPSATAPSPRSHSHAHPYPPPPPLPPLLHHPVPSPPPSSSTSSSVSASKQAFLSLFSTFFDSLHDSRVLTATLDAQIARSASLLATLQQSEVVLERLATTTVEKRLDGLETRWRTDVERSTTQLDRRLAARLDRLESLVSSSSSTAAAHDRRRDRALATTTTMTGDAQGGVVGLGITEPVTSTDARGRAIEARIDKLEKLLSLSRDTQNRARGQRDDRDEDDDEMVVESARREGSQGLPTPHEDAASYYGSAPSAQRYHGGMGAVRGVEES